MASTETGQGAEVKIGGFLLRTGVQKHSFVLCLLVLDPFQVYSATAAQPFPSQQAGM